MNPTPEPAPTLQQLLAFYLEAGVDCALGDEPVNRLAEVDAVPAPSAPRPVAALNPLRPPPAVMPSVPRSEITVAPDAAIASARDAARMAPTLEALRGLLETF